MKKLYRSRNEKMLCGVCGGLSEHLNIDPTIIRLIFAAFGFWGPGIGVYILCIFIIPENPMY